MRSVGRVGLLVCVACLAALLVPAVAGATTLGPCDDGWVAPTPTDVAVTSVPITVSSTEDDYFVLYVKHGRGSDTVLDVPVLIKRGESGTTSLSDSLSPLSADKYRVEKYLISNPADVDGDCADDITELDNFGYRNPTNPALPVAAQHGSVGFEDHAAFEKLSYQGQENLIDVWLKDLEYVKFTILNVYSDSPKLWFQDTDRYRRHWTFDYKFRSVGLGKVVDCCWGGMARGVLIYHPNVVASDGSLGVYRWEFQPYDSFDFREVSLVQETLAAAMPFLKDNLAYYPFISSKAENKYEQEKSLYDASRVRILKDSDIRPDIDYVAYNEAEGYGILGVFEPGESPGPRDVAILSVLPNDLPRAAGVITTVPQTPLSHVNLRAIQNGAPNAFIRDALTDKAVTDLEDSYVYYRTTATGFTLRAATKAEVDAYHAASRPASVQVPQRDLSVQAITSLDDIEFGDWTAFGVKAANVAELSGLTTLAAGVAPDGFAVPFYFYDEFMKQATLGKETVLGKKKAPAEEKITLPAGTTLASAVTQMLAHPKFGTDLDIQEEMLDDLRKAIKNAASPTWIITALTTMHDSFPAGTSLRYRSSTNNEDLPDFNGAGLYDSKTQDPDETVDDGIDKSIKAVWASLWNHRAFLERDFHRVDHTTAAMGVLVHPSYSDEKVNGVAVSFDPVTGLDGHYYVNTQLGEDLVTNPEANSLPEELLLDSAGAATVLARSNLAPANKLFMTDAQMIQLRNSLKAIHDHFETLYSPADGDDFAMEIEFKITSANKLAIKQARPWVFSQPLTECVPQLPTDAVTVEEVRGWRDAQSHPDHVKRWNRVLAALGIDSGETKMMTAAESKTLEAKYINSRWERTTRTLLAIEDCGTSPAEPEISIAAGSGVGEGGDTSFTLTASPVPGADLDVEVSVSQSGDYGVTTGLRTVTIPTSGSYTLAVATGDDTVDEADGSVTATVNTGTGYTVSSSAGSATVAVSDDDVPEISVAAGGAATEGGDAAFTVTADPTPHAALSVDVAVAQSGDFGVSTGVRTVTVPTTGSKAFTVPTTDDGVDEPDGSVTATVNSGTGYTVSSSAGSASVAVSDDDDSGCSVALPDDAVTVPEITAWRDALSAAAAAGIKRFDRVLAAFGVDTGETPMTAEQAQGVADWLGNTRWDRISRTLAAVEQAQCDAEPEVSIAAGSNVTEGGDASFTVTATPKPAADLDVTVTVAQSGDFGVATGSRTITVPAAGSKTFTVSTVNDAVDEADGSVTATVSTGTGYSVSSSAGSTTVAVSDDDDPPPPPPPVPAGCVSDEVLGLARDYFDLNRDHAPSYGRNWRRVLVAFGDVVDDQLTAFTAAEALEGEQIWFGWKPFREALECIEAAQQPEDPEISITAGSAVTEGVAASFTFTANPTPAVALSVSVTVAQSGNYGASTGVRTVTVPTTGSFTLTVATSNDSTDEADGSVTATVNSGTGYTVSSTQSAATVAVSDDDDPPPPPPPPPVPAGCVSDEVLESARDYYDLNRDRAPGFGRNWRRVLVAFGDVVDDQLTAFTAAEALEGEQLWFGWRPFREALECIEAAQQPTDPEISITAGSGVTEGAAAAFTVTASPAPAANLDVTVTVSQSGDFGVTTGARTVTIPTTGSYTLTVATTDDTADETDGSVTVSIDGGTGYTVSSSNSSATVAVADDDAPPPPPPPPPPPAEPQVSIAAGNAVTEGGAASFTITASPAPAAALSVSVTVTQTGEFGVTTGARTVLIPTAASYTLTVATTGDSVDETDGSVTATVNTDNGYTVSSSNSSATVTVADDDVPQISISAGSNVTEGTAASFTLTANPTPAAGLTVNVTITQNGDYGAATGARTVTIPTTGTATFTVTTTNDTTDETDGSVTATIDTGTGYTVSTTQNPATVNVYDNDLPSTGPPTVTVADATAAEDAQHLTFVVTLSKPNPKPITFRYGGYGRTATLWQDWCIDFRKTFTLDAGETEVNIVVPVIDDNTPEDTETFRIYVYATSGIVIRDGFLYATGTITDND